MRGKSTEKSKLLWENHRKPPGDMEFNWELTR